MDERNEGFHQKVGPHRLQSRSSSVGFGLFWTVRPQFWSLRWVIDRVSIKRINGLYRNASEGLAGNQSSMSSGPLSIYCLSRIDIQAILAYISFCLN